jgi:hypothetical protein
MLINTVTETARIDTQRLAYIDEGERSIVDLGVDPIGSLKEF